jgi:hypothetical protein
MYNHKTHKLVEIIGRKKIVRFKSKSVEIRKKNTGTNIVKSAKKRS